MPDSNFQALQSYLVNLATPQSLETMRFWVQDELTRITTGLIDQNVDYRENLVFAGYGSAGISAPVAISAIGIGFQLLPLNTSASDFGTRDVAYDLVADSVAFSTAGVWQGSLLITISFDSVGSNQNLDVQLYNVDDSVAVKTRRVFVPANQGGVSIAFTELVEVTSALVGKNFGVRIGGASPTFTNPTLEDYKIDLTRVSEVKEAI